MRQKSPWAPRLPDGPGRPHERLVAALAEDILAGRIAPNERLPAHRDIAAALGVSLGTVTRAYDVLQRRGLARSERGRGMFVAAGSPPRAQGVDLSVNLPPPVLQAATLSGLIAGMARDIDPAAFARYAPPAGTPEQRTLLARMLSEERGLPVAPGGLLVTNGAQHAIAIALAALPPGPVAMEALTYPGALLAARTMGRPVLPMALDGEGVRPEALEAALAAAAPPVALYLTPTLQNPTGAVMGPERRAALAGIARRAGLHVIEDDIYWLFAPRELPPIARLLPERTLYVGSLSKSVAPGLRVGFLVPPPALADRCAQWLQSTSSMANMLSGLMLAQIVSGRLHASLRASLRAEVARRCALARAVLGAHVAPAAQDGLHLWVPLPTHRARGIVLAAARQNITLAAPEAFMADPASEESGLRLCLGNVPDAELRGALERVAQLLAAGPAAPMV